jgi:hypothetical protein
MAERDTYRILSLDGGGIRGLMTAIWLERLEAELPRPLWKHFDLVAGTSTGAILACAVSKGVRTQKIIDLYTERGHEVFPPTLKRLWSRVGRVFSDGLSAPKYDGQGLEAELRRVFRTTQFGSLKIKPTLVTAYDTFSRKPVVFKNDRAQYAKIKVWEICRSSAAAPAYFPAHVLDIAGAQVPMIDGGVVANNPTACAIAEAFRINDGRRQSGGGSGRAYHREEFLVASFGTGETIRRIDEHEAREWGALQWAVPIVDVLFDGSADSVNYIASQVIRPDNYFRFQVRLEDAYDDMDDASPDNLNALTRLAADYIDSGAGGRQLENLANRLR